MAKLDQEIFKDLKKAYEVLDDVRARLEDINDDLRIGELMDDDYHYSLSDSIEDWLPDIQKLDDKINDYLKNQGETV